MGTVQQWELTGIIVCHLNVVAALGLLQSNLFISTLPSCWPYTVMKPCDAYTGGTLSVHYGFSFMHTTYIIFIFYMKYHTHTTYDRDGPTWQSLERESGVQCTLIINGGLTHEQLIKSILNVSQN